VPTDEIKRLGAKLRAARSDRGLSLGDVASATGMSRSSLSNVENGKGDIGFTRLRRLVELYGMTMMDFAAPHPADARVVRAAEREELRSTAEHISVYMLSPPKAARTMLPLLCVYERGGATTEPFHVDSEEFITVYHGQIEIVFDNNETISLKQGDSIYIHEPHRGRLYRNTSRGRSITLSVLSPPAL
jgi:transcriptional regulator with XRE-family HTH domain